MTNTTEDNELLELETKIVMTVMGWRSFRETDQGGFWSPEKRRTQLLLYGPLHHQRLKLGIDHDAVGDGFVFSPVRHMPDAWLVVTRMMQQKYTWSGNGNGTSSEWMFMDNGTIVGHAGGTTVQIAICLAALKAVNGKG